MSVNYPCIKMHFSFNLRINILFLELIFNNVCGIKREDRDELDEVEGCGAQKRRSRVIGHRWV